MRSHANSKRSPSATQPALWGSRTKPQLLAELAYAREVHAKLTKRILELSVALSTPEHTTKG